MDFDEIVQGRKSVKNFLDKKPDWRDIIEAIDSARYTPMAGDNYTLKFVVVDEQSKINELAQAADQDFIAKAKYVVAVVSNTSRTTNAYGKRGEVYCHQQAGAAIQNFILKLEELELSTCWVGHFNDGKVKKILKVPEELNIEAIFPVGYESKIKTKQRKRRIEMDLILRFNDYKNKSMQKQDKMSA